MPKLTFVIAIALGMLLPVAVLACAPGAKCLTVPKSSASSANKGISSGDALQPGSFQMIVNSRHYGLPLADTGMFYVRVGNRALKVKRDGYIVVEDVTHLTNAAF